MPLVSVVLSAHNDADRVSSAVESIRAQTFTDWELIAIDDGSSDGTSDALDCLAAQDARMRVIHQENTGLTKALIRGCGAAQGKYIARQDSDDWSHPRRLTEQVELLEGDARLGLVSCWTQYVGPRDEELEIVERPADSEVATRQLLDERQGPPAHGSVMFRKDLYERVGGYRPEFYYGQDSDLWLRMAERSLVGYVTNVRYSFRQHLRSISGESRLYQREFGRLGQACRAARREGRAETSYLAEAASLTAEITAQRAAGRKTTGSPTEMAYLIGSRLAQNGDRRGAKYLWAAIRHRPWHWKAWLRLVQSLMGRGERRAASGE